MNVVRPWNRPRIAYQVSITALFVAVVLLVGLTLVTLSLDRAKEITRTAAIGFIDRVAHHTADRLDSQFRAAAATVGVLPQLPLITSGSVSDPLLPPLLAALLRENKQLYNVYAGYDDGSFVEMDALERAGPGARKLQGETAGAVFRLVVIPAIRGAEGRTRSTAFLDHDLRSLSVSSAPADYDPRERPWYKDAFEASARAITDPYVSANGQTGYTVRKIVETGRRGVVAVDILLSETEAFMRDQKLTPSAVANVFDEDDYIVAHPRMSEIIKTATGTATGLSLPRLGAANTIDVREPVAAWRAGGSSHQFFAGPGGRLYVGAFRKIAWDGATNLNLVVAAPLDEFFSEIEAARRSLLITALVLVAAAMPFVFWIGSLLSRSLQRLAAETDRIQRFEITETPRLRSVVREIDDLARSVHTMRTVVQTFSSFVPRRLVQQLVESGAAMTLGGTRRPVTVMFTDIDGFTGITENADPEKVMLFTSRYLAMMSDVLMEHHGTVDKFVGDAVMAIWNAPSDDPDHVGHACAAALACRDAGCRLNEVFALEGWPAYRTRFGLHTGDAVVGNIGSADRMNYTVLGATVNLAARLEPLNKQYRTQVLVSEDVVSRASDRFSFRLVDVVRPKGFEEPVRIFELLGPMEQPGRHALPIKPGVATNA